MDDDRNASSGDLESFQKRLNQTKASIEQRDRQASSKSSAYSFGFRLASDLVVGVLVGFGIGWVLDRWLGTSPWFLLIFTPLGVVAGIFNVIRAAKSVEARRHLEQTRADHTSDSSSGAAPENGDRTEER